MKPASLILLRSQAVFCSTSVDISRSLKTDMKQKNTREWIVDPDDQGWRGTRSKRYVTYVLRTCMGFPAKIHHTSTKILSSWHGHSSGHIPKDQLESQVKWPAFGQASTENISVQDYGKTNFRRPREYRHEVQQYPACKYAQARKSKKGLRIGRRIEEDAWPEIPKLMATVPVKEHSGTELPGLGYGGHCYLEKGTILGRGRARS